MSWPNAGRVLLPGPPTPFRRLQAGTPSATGPKAAPPSRSSSVDLMVGPACNTQGTICLTE